MSGRDLKDPAWLEFRSVKLGHAFNARHKDCLFCGLPMWFTDFETIPEFLARVGGPDLKLTRAQRKNRVATLDHVIPKSFFALDHYVNLVGMCYACNQDKGKLLPDDWIKQREASGRKIPSRARRKLQKKAARTLKVRDKINQRRQRTK